MDLTAGLRTLWGSLRLRGTAGIILIAGLGACGSSSDDGGSSTDAGFPPLWDGGQTYSSCEDFATAAVGSYLIASNYWNKDKCPGTQCIEINKATGAFSVGPGPVPCAPAVSSYPNVLYGCSYGNCSPATKLPMKVSEVTSLTSSWDFSAGGSSSKDAWNVSYDIWFCPDKNCGASGFPKGLELMIWLDYKNAAGWKDHIDTVTLSGSSWEVWKADMQVGGATDAWGYMNYITPKRVTSVKDLDLYAFIQDAVKRGLVKSEWYLYAVQAGMEVRTGGMPFTSNSFSIVLNGETPPDNPVPAEGPSCDGGVPTAEGQLTINGTYVTAGPLHGYGAAWTSLTDTEATICSSPLCTAGQTGAIGTCAPPLGPSALCTAGIVSADRTYHATAGLGFELNQEQFVGEAPVVLDASIGEIDGGIDGGMSSIDGGGIPAIGSITVPTSVTVSVTRTEGLSGNLSLRAQLTDESGVIFCYGGPLNEAIPIGKFNTQCWNNKGIFATPSMRFTRLDIIVPSSAATDLPFGYCLGNVVIQ